MNHLWQSTLFAGLAALLALALRKNRARTRYWLWMAASLKFLIPFSLLVGIGGQIGWRAGVNAPTPRVVFAIEQVSQLVTPRISMAPDAPAAKIGPNVVMFLWPLGSIVLMPGLIARSRSVPALAPQPP